jgi:hypothetical protein
MSKVIAAAVLLAFLAVGTVVVVRSQSAAQPATTPSAPQPVSVAAPKIADTKPVPLTPAQQFAAKKRARGVGDDVSYWVRKHWDGWVNPVDAVLKDAGFNLLEFDRTKQSPLTRVEVAEAVTDFLMATAEPKGLENALLLAIEDVKKEQLRRQAAAEAEASERDRQILERAKANEPPPPPKDDAPAVKPPKAPR